MTTEVMLYGDIGEDWWSGEGITEVLVLEALQKLDPLANQHDIRINSPGGRVDTGLAIFNLLRSHAAQMKVFNPTFKLCTIVDGYAMSVASVIMMAGDIRRLALGGVVMIHDAWTYCAGNAVELRAAADNMDKLSLNAANVYAQQAGQKDKDSAYFRTLMTAESYFIGQEALDAGLVTEIEQTEAVLFLPPEKIKGHYAQIMSDKSRNKTVRRPMSLAALSDRKEAAKRLQLLSAEIITQ